MGLALSILLGWLAGGLANWAADALPGRSDRQPRTAGAPGFPAVLVALPHYLTLPWHAARRGVCPHCGERRPARVPLLEAAGIAALAATCLLTPAACLLTPTAWSLAVAWLYTAFLLAVVVIDIEHRLVLNVMLAPAAVAALLLSLRPGGPGVVNALAGGGAGLALFAIIALLGRGKMGAGDVKLAGVIGLMAGFPAVFTALLIGIVAGGLAALILVLTRRAGLKSHIAYAPYLCLGAWIVLVT